MRKILAALLAAFWPSVALAKPNFVVIMMDDMPTSMATYMPLTRSLVRDPGLRFEEAFVENPLCSPSRVSFLTGRYAHNHGVHHNDVLSGGYAAFKASGLEASALPAQLQSHGYRTALVGKYLNNYSESRVPPGWSTWIAGSSNIDAGWNYWLNENGSIVTYGTAEADYSTDVLAGFATQFIEDAGTEPFFLYFAAPMPHAPSVPATRHKALYPGVTAPRSLAFNEINVVDKPPFVAALSLLTQPQIAALDAAYLKAIRSLAGVDEAVRLIYEALRDSGKLANTYVFFTSDHGYHYGEHRLALGKTWPYESDLRIPLWIRGPGIEAGRSDTTHMIVNVDLAPTILQLAGDFAQPGADGRSFRPFLRNVKPATPWRSAFPISRWQQPGALLSYPDFHGVRTSAQKWVGWADGSIEYYDLEDDPQELASSPSTALEAFSEELATCVGADCRASERPVEEP